MSFSSLIVYRAMIGFTHNVGIMGLDKARRALGGLARMTCLPIILMHHLVSLGKQGFPYKVHAKMLLILCLRVRLA